MPMKQQESLPSVSGAFRRCSGRFAFNFGRTGKLVGVGEERLHGRLVWGTEA